ncbi:MAG: endonuclease/exonuclease/phosphatase family protein [Planctomycetota bacterium]
MRLLVKVLRSVPLAIQVALLLPILAWLIGRILTDRFLWSQWCWWMPTVLAIGLAACAAFIAAMPFPPRRGRATRCVFWIVLTLGLLGYRTEWEQRGPILHDPITATDGFELVHWTCTMSAPHLRATHAAWATTFTGDAAILMHSGGLFLDPAMDDVRANGYRVYPVGLATVITRHELVEHRTILRNGNFFGWTIHLRTAADADDVVTIWLLDLPSNPRIHRWEIASRVRDMLDNANEPRPDLVIGDLNITRGSASLQHLFPDYEHAYDQAGFGDSATFPRERPVYHIDHVLIRAPWRAQRYDLHDPGHGRHRLQRVWLERSH